ncbi:MAG: sulfatase-like hydrolase/transferase [Bryobacterales bacterium]|nr:sulfatase-like hydrolase/transferase [Bryobacterales bacterium]
MITRRALLASLTAPLAAQTRKPNIVLIVSDDHHWQCLSAAGNPNISTPNLDRLAQRGVLFQNAIISSSQCAPSRGILLSGLECYQNGLDSNGHITFRFFRGATVVEQLRRAGYETNLVGKWHIEPTPKECGFTKAPIWLEPAATAYLNPPLRHGLDATADTDTPGHITEIFTQHAVNVIRQARQPYLLWLTYNAPHTPWTASEQYRKLYEGKNASLAPPNHPKPQPSRQPTALKGTKKKGGAAMVRPDGRFDWETYYAVISELDANIGKVIEAIEASGQWNNTLILFFGDNGFLCGAKGLQGKVHPWESSLRIPFIASGGLVKRPAKSSAMAASVDVPATVLDYAGIRSSHPLAGLSLRSAINGAAFPRDASFSAWNDGRVEALFAGFSVEPYRAVRTATHKLILWESGKQAFFDLRTDPFEEKDLAADPAHAAALRSIQDRLRARMKATADPAAGWFRPTPAG